MKKTSNISPLITYPVTANVNKNHFVSVTGNYSATVKTLGVVTTSAKAGSYAGVQQSGIAIVTAGSAISVGSAIGSNASGKAIALTISTASDVNKLAGYALDAASTDGDLIRIKIN